MLFVDTEQLVPVLVALSLGYLLALTDQFNPLTLWQSRRAKAAEEEAVRQRRNLEALQAVIVSLERLPEDWSFGLDYDGSACWTRLRNNATGIVLRTTPGREHATWYVNEEPYTPAPEALLRAINFVREWLVLKQKPTRELKLSPERIAELQAVLEDRHGELQRAMRLEPLPDNEWRA